MISTPAAALYIMSREQYVKSINMRMTSNINGVTYGYNWPNHLCHILHFFMFFSVESKCCGMENDTQCGPIMRSGDKSQKPAIG